MIKDMASIHAKNQIKPELAFFLPLKPTPEPSEKHLLKRGKSHCTEEVFNTGGPLVGCFRRSQ